MSGFRARYGASPLHLLLVLGSFALTGYAGIRLLDGDAVWMVVVWFIGAALLHDLVLLPLYTVTDRAAQAALGSRRRGPAAQGAGRPPSPGLINHVRAPVFLSGVLLLTYFPLILGQVEIFTAYTGLSDDVFLGRWLLITAALFAISALWLLVGMWSARPPRPSKPPRTPGTTPGP